MAGVGGKMMLSCVLALAADVSPSCTRDKEERFCVGHDTAQLAVSFKDTEEVRRFVIEPASDKVVGEGCLLGRSSDFQLVPCENAAGSAGSGAERAVSYPECREVFCIKSTGPLEVVVYADARLSAACNREITIKEVPDGN